MNDATATTATGEILTAMACCPLPTGRAGHGSAPWRVTEASVSFLRRCREGVQVVETKGGGRPVAHATILLVASRESVRRAWGGTCKEMQLGHR